MTLFDIEAAKAVNSIVQIVELEPDFCGESYGVGNCTAAKGVTGLEECYNGFNNCQDVNNYLRTTKNWRYHIGTSDFIPDSLPFVKNIDITAQTLNNDGTIGGRAGVTITLWDGPFTDRGVDPYVASRSRDGKNFSTYWRKWIHRYPFYRGRALKIRTGFLTSPFDFDAFQTSHFIIESIKFNNNDTITITGVDQLKKAGVKSAQAPLQNTGTLDADINSSATSFSVTLSGIKTIDEEYGTSGRLVIGEELMSYTRTLASSTFTVVRSLNGVVASHTAGDTAQQCYFKENVLFWDVIYDLLVNPTNATTHNAIFPAAKINKVQWDADMVPTKSLNFSNWTIAEPTGIDELISELVLANQSNIWSDVVLDEIVLKPVALPLFGIKTLGDAGDIYEGTFSQNEKPGEQATQVWTGLDIRNPVKDIKEQSNYRLFRVSSDPGAESEDQYNQVFIEKILVRSFGPGQEGLATALSSRVLAQRRDPPKDYGLTIDIKDAKDIDLGSSVELNSRELVDIHGNSAPIAAFVTSKRMIDTGKKYVMILRSLGKQRRFARFMDQDDVSLDPDFLNATEFQKNNGGYFSDNLGKMTDGSEGYLFA